MQWGVALEQQNDGPRAPVSRRPGKRAMTRRWRHRRRGVLLYVGLGLMMVLSVLGSALIYYASAQELNAVMVEQSEVITNLAEAAAEEAFMNFEMQLNQATNTKIYRQLREPMKPGETVDIDTEYMAKCTEAARRIGQEQFHIPPEKFIVEGLIHKVQPFDIRGAVVDELEKSAALTVKVTITHQKDKNVLTKVVVLSRPVKVVRCTIPVLSECTLFLNNLTAQTFAEWESVLGYRKDDFPKEQQTLTLDHGWASYSTTNTKEDFLKHFEERVLTKGAVPPGRVFINRGIVPITNGNRSSGMLQKTFYSAESELLPKEFDFTLKQLREHYEKAGIPTDDLEDESEESTGATSGTSSPQPEATSTAPTGDTTDGDAISEDIEKSRILIRYLGHGCELGVDDCKELIGKDFSGFRTWFQSFIDDDWKQKGDLYARSGLDIFGRVEEKNQGEAVSEEGGNFLQRLWQGIKKITKQLMDKLYSKYHIKISPTIVYGQVLRTFFAACDYIEGKWWEKIKNTAKLSGNERPLPWFPKGFLEGKDDKKPLEMEDLPAAWDKDLKEKWLKLPKDVRKPKFFKYLDQTIFSKETYGLDDPDWKMAIEKLPHGAMYRPYNQGLLEFLGPLQPDSYVAKYFGLFMSKGVYFNYNELDVQANDNEIGHGPFESYFEKGLHEFNPFLYYVKATDYISSLNDPRIDPKDPRHNVFRRKYFDEKEGTLHLDGVIYITGTEPLQLGNVRYTGKAVIITFGPVIFTGFVAKSQDSADDPEKNDLLTIVSLGGIDIKTDKRIDAQLYSYIYPVRASDGQKIHLFGGLGCNDLNLKDMPEGGNINFDWTYHIPPGMDIDDRKHYYHVSITDEISKYEYFVRKQFIVEE